MCQNAFFLYLQGIRIMRRSKREEQNTHVWSAKLRKQFPAIFKILLKKI